MSDQSSKLHFEIGQDATRADIGKRSVDGTSALKPDSDLKRVEKSAAKEVGDWSNVDQDGVNKAEEEVEKLYSGSGKEDKKTIPKDAKGLFKGAIKKFGPVVGIFIFVAGIGIIMTTSQTFQPFSLVAQFEEKFNTMHISANRRANIFFRLQMSNGRTKNPVRGGKIFGKKLSISEKQAQELKKQGIEYDEDYEGKKVLKYEGSDGKQKIVDADNFKQVYYSDPDFFKKYNAGSMTWRGKIANWFGTNTESFLKNNKLTRNLWEKYKERVEEMKGDSLKTAKEMVGEKTKFDGEVDTVVAKEGEDEDGNKKFEGSDDKVKSDIERGESMSSAKPKAKSLLNDISGNFSKAANVGCAIFNMIGTVSLLVAANDAIQILNLATSMFEAVDKTKAGLGEEAPINDMALLLNQDVESTFYPIEGEGNGNVTENGIEGLSSGQYTINGSAMESAGISALYGGGVVDPNNPSVQSLNLTGSIKRILGGLGVKTSTYMGCLAARAGAAAISIATDGIEIAGCVAGLLTGVGAVVGCAPLALSIAGSVAIGVGLGAAISAVASLLLPTVANRLSRNLIDIWGGVVVGEGLTSAALMYASKVHFSNGGSPTSIDNYIKFRAAALQVLAEDAKFERMNLSPFDMTSKNTFMGVLLTNVMNISHASNIMSIVKSGSSMINTSLAKLSPGALAYDVTSDLPSSMEEYVGACPYPASINAIGDSYCNQYAASDLSMDEKDPVYILDKVDEYGGLNNSENDENVSVDPDSRLAEFIRYCGNRSSMFGVADQNIANEIGSTGDVNTSNSTINGALNGGIGAVPVIGDVIDIIQSEEQLSGIGYITGESCVIGNNVDASGSPNRNEANIYRTFMSDQSLAESMGLIEKSAVTAYLEDYYKEHPLDNSYEGMLARYSGLTKDNVIALLDYIEYVDYVAQYDPSTRYAFGAPAVEPTSEIFFEKENVMSGDGILLGVIVYADVRNRSFAV